MKFQIKWLIVLVVVVAPCFLFAQEQVASITTKKDSLNFSKEDSLKRDQFRRNFMSSMVNGDENLVIKDFLECCIFTSTSWNLTHDDLYGQMGGYDLPKYQRINSIFQGRKVRAVNFTPSMLYRLAYWHDVLPDRDELPSPKRYIAEISDTVKERLLTKEYNRSNSFGYLRITKTPKSEAELSKIMQQDLDNFFGVKSKVEKRKMRCYALIKKDTSAVTKGGAPILEVISSRYKLVNQPVSALALVLRKYYESGKYGNFAVINETGWKGNIDIEFSTKFEDINSIKADLQKYGFDIVEKDAEVSVIVVID